MIARLPALSTGRNCTGVALAALMAFGVASLSATDASATAKTGALLDDYDQAQGVSLDATTPPLTQYRVADLDDDWRKKVRKSDDDDDDEEDDKADRRDDDDDDRRRYNSGSQRDDDRSRTRSYRYGS